MAGKNWVGTIVSVDCGEILGAYQGLVSSVDEKHQTITLQKAYRNGMQCKNPEITICCQDIQGLRILKTAGEVQRPESHRQDTRLSPPKTTESVKVDDRKRTQSESRKTPKKTENRRKWMEKDEACFSAPIDDFILENDFDFEKNLALFDKQAVFDEIEASTKPDIVRLVDCNKRKPQKYRCDENVIEHAPVSLRQISVPEPDKTEFVTDTGLVVPSIHPELRERLLLVAEKHGLVPERQLEMIGRAAAEMAVQLLGGSHRLNPQNIHQKPVVTVLCGPHFQGLQGLSCARHLANHGADVIVCFPVNIKVIPLVTSELRLYSLTEGKTVSTAKELPTGCVDLVINAVDGRTTADSLKLWQRSVIDWANSCRAPVLTLDPPPGGPSIVTRYSIFPGLPLCVVSAGNIYLCDVGIPAKVFKEVGIVYASPFGSKFVVPLHLKTG